MEFEKKSAEQIEKMTAQEVQSYYVAKMTHEKGEMEAKITDIENRLDSEKEAKEIEVLKEGLEAMKVSAKEQGLLLTRVKNSLDSVGAISAVDGTIEKALSENAENFKNAKNSREEFAFELDIKAVSDMTFAANLSGGNMPQAQRLDGINDIAERVAQTYGRIPKMQTNANTIDWVYETLQEGAAAGTAEGVIKNQIDNNFVVTSVSLLKQTAYFKVSTEMLADVSFMGAWLRNKLITRLFLRIDSQVLVGGGTGTDLNGLYTQATAFAAGTFATGSANQIDNANQADVLVVAALNIRTANHMGSLTIFMNPTDVAVLKTVKLSATDKRYVDRLMMMGSTLSLDGMPIVETTAMTAGNYLIGDMSKALIAERSGISVEVGLDSGDFLKNMRSILAEWRGEVIIENNDTTAFVKGVFATDAAAMETV